ncbi:MAG: Cardiolipin synthase A [Chlamydiia bacterium]|nr:Cardiolipin synthase A [Chlamydiia bacterium]MCH9618851.1 Cardiolipin synthase A [Chlamydiia bacterium]MCH9624548.1 Cardiolipin synthase A [Chlamydiia bacterium]
MYALTHKKIIAEIIAAHKRGVDTTLYLDKGMANGTCKKYIALLQKEGVPIFIREKGGLLHHKSALIDTTYIFGSANWSASGFQKNEETLLFIKDPPEKLLLNMNTFLKNTKYYSKALPNILKEN